MARRLKITTIDLALSGNIRPIMKTPSSTILLEFLDVSIPA
jgi:hypothetical protein